MNERNEKIANVDDELFAKKANELFDQSVQGLDAAAQSRLNRGRHEALAQLQPGVRRGQWQRWAPATAVAAAAVVAVVLMTGRPAVDELTPLPTANDFEIMLNEDSFEMLEELEFYTWIDLEAEQESNGNVG